MEVLNADTESIVGDTDFETAISATGFGKFNILVLCATVLVMFAIMFDTASAAYIVASGAHCDLNLSNAIIGAMFSGIYAGMITSAIPWSYIADTFGRKPVIVYGLLIDSVVVIISSFTQHAYFLLTCRYVSGLCICGPFASLYTYLAETNSVHRRHPIIFSAGIFLSVGSLVLPLLAMAIIPSTWEIQVLDYKYHSWHLFLLLCALPALISGICFLFFPESPKFLMTQGRNDEAMASFTRIFHMNKGKAGIFPIKSLTDDKMELKQKKQDVELTKMQIAKQQFIDVIFSKAYVWKALMVFSIDFCVMMCQNTVRLWMPKILKVMEVLNDFPDRDQSFCAVLDVVGDRTVKKPPTNATKTAPNCNSVTTVHELINNFYQALAAIVCFFIAVSVVNKVGVKHLLCVSMGLSAIFAPMLYFSEKLWPNLIFATAYLCMEHIASSNVVAVSATIFPTQVRATIVSSALLIGRVGSMSGNLIMPILLDIGCLPPILWLTVVSLFAFIMSIFIPKVTGRHLK